MTQARMAARRLDARVADSAASNPAIEELVRCARLSQDAARTLEWALHTLRAHSTDRAETAACQLLRAARARLDTGPADDSAAASPRSLATP